MDDKKKTKEQLVAELTKVREQLEAQANAYARARKAYEAEMKIWLEEQTAKLQREVAERERLQQETIEAQKHAIQELSTPVIPIMDHILVMPLVGSIDTLRARDITRQLLDGIDQHRANVLIIDITGVPLVDSGVADHLNKTILAARLKGAYTIITGISNAVAGTIVDLGIDWSGMQTVRDLQAGLLLALRRLGLKLTRVKED